MRAREGLFPAGRSKAPSGTWQPFRRANTAAVTHGATSRNPDSPAGWGPLARQLSAELVDVAPWTSQPAFAASVAAWARVEAQLQLLDAWLGERGLLDGEGNPRPAVNLLNQFEKRAESLRARLGLDPASWAKLLASLSAGEGGADDELEHLRAVGRRIIQARESNNAAVENQENG
jgi:hypothetical protein